MDAYLRPEVLLLCATGVTAVGVAALAGRQRSAPGAMPIAMLALGVMIYAVGYAFELATVSLSVKILWAKIQYFGLVTTPTAWIVVAVQYTGHGAWLTRRNIALLFAIPLLTLGLAWTNELHGLIWSDIRLDTTGPLSILRLSHGAVFWLFTGYVNLVLFIGVVLALETLLQASAEFRRSSAALIVSAIIPWAASMAFLFGWKPLGINPTSFALAVSGGIIFWAVFRAGLFESSPAVWRMAFEQMDKAVLILDSSTKTPVSSWKTTSPVLYPTFEWAER